MPAEGLPQLSVEKKNTKKSFPHAGIRELLEFQSFSFINRHVQIACRQMSTFLQNRHSPMVFGIQKSISLECTAEINYEG